VDFASHELQLLQNLLNGDHAFLLEEHGAVAQVEVVVRTQGFLFVLFLLLLALLGLSEQGSQLGGGLVRLLARPLRKEGRPLHLQLALL
jgi:hypothetical protein